ncbi:hypothetical protein C0989_006215 [Termitomyces sp. Mn162]|nr:hypothetical protein C0989_006215 [Termitomyces sp. Mn162]
MLMVSIHDGGLAPRVNTVKEFVLEAKAYESSIKTAVHYSECSKKSWSGQQLSFAAAQSPAIGIVLAKQREVTDQHGQSQLLWSSKRPAVCVPSRLLILRIGVSLGPSQPVAAVQAARKHLAAGKNVVAIASGQPSKDAGQSANCYKCKKARHFACKCREPAKPAPWVFVWAAHTAVLSDAREANDEQEEELAEADANEAFESNET